jgi:hypothetical protein
MRLTQPEDRPPKSTQNPRRLLEESRFLATLTIVCIALAILAVIKSNSFEVSTVSVLLLALAFIAAMLLR